MKIAAIFDMDGVIVDNLSYHIEAWKVYAGNNGIKLTNDFFLSKMNGRTMAGCLEALFSQSFSKEEIQEASREKERLYREIYRDHISPTRALLLFLESLKSAKGSLCSGHLCSTRKRELYPRPDRDISFFRPGDRRLRRHQR